MNARTTKLRQRSLDAIPSLTPERASLLTDFYQTNAGRFSVPVLRAKAFPHLCQHKTIYLGDDELIVGERGPRPKAVPTFPELTCHSREDLRILNSRPKTWYRVDDLFAAYRAQFKHCLEIKLRGNQLIERLYATLMPAPFLSVLTDDCVKKGLDYNAGGALLNMKFTPSLVVSNEGLDKWAHLVRSYFKMDGHHVQFNVVTADALRQAQARPDEHRDLIVRVAGYSDFFCDLSSELQAEIIDRTEHRAF